VGNSRVNARSNRRRKAQPAIGATPSRVFQASRGDANGTAIRQRAPLALPRFPVWYLSIELATSSKSDALGLGLFASFLGSRQAVVYVVARMSGLPI
jgi:hypothetical protein